MRTDQLILGNTGIPVSQLLAVVMAVGCGALLIYKRIKLKGQPALEEKISEEMYEDGFTED